MPIEGIFFENQILTAQGLGAFGDAALSDGILTGFYPIGSTSQSLTVPEGYMVIRGRVFKVPETTLRITTGSSSVAYTAIIVTVDTTQGSTEESFNQVSMAVSQGSSIAAVTATMTSDINMTGTTASAVLAILNTSTSSPTVLGYNRSVGKSLRQLWTRDSTQPMSPNGDTVTIPTLCAYDAALVVFRRGTTSLWFMSMICPYEKGVDSDYTYSLSAPYVSTSFYNYTNQRLVTFNGAKGTVTFSKGWYAGGSSVGDESQNTCIPHAIYGMAVH